MNYLVEVLDSALALVRDVGCTDQLPRARDAMTRAETDRLIELGERAYELAFTTGLDRAFPRPEVLLSEGAAGPDFPNLRLHPILLSKFHLPGDWYLPPPAEDDGPPPLPHWDDAAEPAPPVEAVFLTAPTARWFRDMDMLRRLAGAGAVPTAPAKAGGVPTSRLTVDEARQTITLDGVTHEVRSVTAIRWVRILAAFPGEWISGGELERRERDVISDSEEPKLIKARTDRLRPKLPAVVAELIDSRCGGGSRIRL